MHRRCFIPPRRAPAPAPPTKPRTPYATVCIKESRCMNYSLGPSAGDLPNKYAIVPEGASYLAGSHMPEGPCDNTEQEGGGQRPVFTFKTINSTCKLTFFETGEVLVQHNRNGEHSQNSYSRVTGFIVTSHNTSNQGPMREFEVKIVYILDLYDQIKKTKSIWKHQSLSVLPSMRQVKQGFFTWVMERGLDVIDDQY